MDWIASMTCYRFRDMYDGAMDEDGCCCVVGGQEDITYTGEYYNYPRP